MDIQHLQVKLFIEDPDRINLTDHLSIFSEWIQQQNREELLIDVADYRHVPNGPGVILVGHEASYSIDHEKGRLGLLYNQKTALEGEPKTHIQQAIRRLLDTAALLQAHPTQQGVLSFNKQELLFTINDRLLAPNTIEGFQAFANELSPVLDEWFDGYRYDHASLDSRERLAIRMISDHPIKDAVFV